MELQRTPQPTSANQKRVTNRRNQKPLLQNKPRAHQSEHHGGPRHDNNKATCTTYLTPHGVFERIAELQSCVSPTNAMIDDEPAKNTTFWSKKPKHTTFGHPSAPGNSSSTPSRAFNSLHHRRLTQSHTTRHFHRAGHVSLHPSRFTCFWN